MPVDKLRFGVTVGDTAGIGLEVLYGALQSQGAKEFEFVLYAHPITVESYYNSLYGKGKWELPDNVRIEQCGIPSVIDFANPNKETAVSAIASLNKASVEVIGGKVDAVITLPISKSVLQSVGWKFPGQTEFFADCAQTEKYLMVLCTKTVRVALVTIHEPLHTVAGLINSERIENTIRLFHESLRKDFGINKPGIAVLGLNPHAGENGSIGTEEHDVISPTITRMKGQGFYVSGPYPADGFFAHGAFQQFDGILAMYHDQGLIPLKMLASGGGVNVTAGLPIVRTSPDHGTAYSIAGQHLGDSSSMKEAIEMAANIVKNRVIYEENT